MAMPSTTILGRSSTSNLESKSSFSHYQVLKMGYMNKGKIYLLDHKTYSVCFKVSK